MADLPKQFKISTSPSEIIIEIGARNQSAFWIMGLLILIPFTVTTLRLLLSFKEQVWLIEAVPIIFIFIFGLLAVHGVAWSLTGKEIVTVKKGELSYERSSWKVDNQILRLDPSTVTRFEIVPHATFDMLRNKKIRAHVSKGFIAFGSDLKETEAVEIVQHLKSSPYLTNIAK